MTAIHLFSHVLWTTEDGCTIFTLKTSFCLKNRKYTKIRIRLIPGIWTTYNQVNTNGVNLLTSAQRIAEVRALQRALYFYLLGYVFLYFVVYASLILDGFSLHRSKDFNRIDVPDKAISSHLTSSMFLFLLIYMSSKMRQYIVLRSFLGRFAKPEEFY